MPQIPADTASPAHLSPPVSNSNPALRPVQTPVTAAPGMGNVPTDPDDEEGLKHLEQVKCSNSFVVNDHESVEMFLLAFYT